MSVDDLRRYVLGLSGIMEGSHHAKPDFRYRNRIVVNLDETERSITIKLDLAEQAALLAADVDAFKKPGGWAKHGWTTIMLDLVDREEIKELVQTALSRMQESV